MADINAGMSNQVRRMLGGLAVLTVAIAAAAAPASADTPVVPILTGAELHWAGSATRTYSGHSDDNYVSSTDQATSTISWDARYLIAGHYVDDPVTPVPDLYILATDDKKVLGSGKEDQTWTCDPGGDPDCPGTISQPSHCTWTERSNGASAFVVDAPVGRVWALSPMGVSIRGNTMVDGASDYSCADQYDLYDPGMWGDCDTLDTIDHNTQADACGAIFTFPDTPAEGDAATITQQFDHTAGGADCHRIDDSYSCGQTGKSTLTVKCALCVTDIAYEQPDLPGRGWTAVPPSGTFDGNKVRVTATVHNATGHAITAPVRFRDLTTVRDLPPAADGQKPDAQISFPAGGDTKVVLDWDTEGFAWYAPHKPDPHKIAVLTPYGGGRRDLSVRPKPVLLVHGWNSGPATWDGYPDNFTNVRSDWLARPATGMDTNPLSGNSITTNAQILASDIDHLRDELDAEHVDLVVHSMGGLISRAYLQYDAPDDPDQRPVVAHLVMLGTPNRGSNCGTVTGPIAFVAAGGRGAAIPTLQLSPIYIEGWFNRHVTNTRGTKLSVLAGIAPIAAEAASAFVCTLQTPNDLVVWRDSAFWTLTDTATQDGLVHTDMTHNVQAFTTFVRPHLAVTPDGASVRASVRAATGRRGAVATAAKAKPAVTAAAGPGLDLVKGVTVPARATRRVPVTVAGASELGVLALAPTGVEVALQDPKRKQMATATSAGELTTLVAKRPRPGRWTIVLHNTTASSSRVGVGAVLRGDRFKVTPKLTAAGSRLELKVSVRGGGGRTTATAVARALDDTGKRVTVRLRRSGSAFTASLKSMAGGTAVVITVRGAHGTRVAMAQAAGR